MPVYLDKNMNKGQINDISQEAEDRIRNAFQDQNAREATAAAQAPPPPSPPPAPDLSKMTTTEKLSLGLQQSKPARGTIVKTDGAPPRHWGPQNAA